MTLDECREHIGDGVVYTAYNDGVREDGTLTSTSKTFAFVRFVGDNHAKACLPSDLELESS